MHLNKVVLKNLTGPIYMEMQIKEWLNKIYDFFKWWKKQWHRQHTEYNQAERVLKTGVNHISIKKKNNENLKICNNNKTKTNYQQDFAIFKSEWKMSYQVSP